MSSFTHAEVAHIIGLPTEAVAHLAELDMTPECDGEWSNRQVLALIAKVHTRWAGATQAASDQAFWILSRMRLGAVTRDCQARGRRYLLLVGEVCQPRLLTEADAFNADRLLYFSEAGIPHVVFDIEPWISRLYNERAELALRRKRERTAASEV